jgi:hypothetical protein
MMVFSAGISVGTRIRPRLAGRPRVRGPFPGSEKYLPAADFGKPRDLFARGTLPGMKAIGRFAQCGGLALPAVAIVLELNHRITLGQMLVLLVAAVCCFWIGRIVEGYAGG